jgi:hypothetical protein
MAFFLRLLLIAFLFYLIIWIIRGLVAPREDSRETIYEDELVSDALTGTYFPKSKAVIINKDGQKLYFSSVANRDQWLHENGRQI